MCLQKGFPLDVTIDDLEAWFGTHGAMETVFMRKDEKKLFKVRQPCADPESFVRGGPTVTGVFFVDEGRRDPNTTISVPSTAG